MTLSAAPLVSIGGQSVGLNTTGSTQAGDSIITTGLSAINSLQVTWGRSELTQQPTPATCTVVVHDHSSTHTLATNTELLGQEVLVSWRGSDESSPTRHTLFRGRVTDSDVTPALVAGGGYFVTVTATSREAEVANYSIPAGTAAWPAETFASRLTRILAPLGLASRPNAVLAGRVTLPSYHDVPNMPTFAVELSERMAAPMSGPQGDVLSLLRELWLSVSPLPMVYDPATDGFRAALRREFHNTGSANFGHTKTAGLFPAAARGGRYVAAAVGGYDLSGRVLVGRGGLSQPLESRITNVEVTYYDSSAANAQALVTATTTDTPNEATIGRRTLSVASIHNTTSDAQSLAGMYADLASNELRGRRLSPIVYRTDLADGFSSTGQRAALLSAAETSTPFFVSSSWLPRVGKRPLVGLIGGSIVYSGGEWTITATPAPVGIYDTATLLPLKFGTAATAGVPVSLIDPSVTFGDAAYLEVGAGYTTANQPSTPSGTIFQP